MSQPKKQNDEVASCVKQALQIANELCTAVLRGDKGQQRLALNYARAYDDAKRAGLDLTERA